jgi:hypothetical protein
MLSSVLSDESTPLHVRNAASLALKNALTARVSLLVISFFFPRALLTYSLAAAIGEFTTNRQHQ